jgi:hypothetical protein
VIYPIIGRRELGKTTLARYMAAARAPRLIVDPRNQWPVGDAVIWRSVNGEAISDMLARGGDVLVQPNDLQGSVDELAIVVRGHFENAEPGERRELSVVLDECGLYDLNAWSWVMRCSPREQCSIILTAHRPRDIHTNIRALADTWCIFRTTQRHDLDAIEERCGPLVAQRVETLDRFHFIAWDDAKAEMTLHDNPALWREPNPRPLAGRVIEEKKPRRLWED